MIQIADLSFAPPPSTASVQGMFTITLESEDKRIKPNIIVTLEELSQPISLDEYFNRIRAAVSRRGIMGFRTLQLGDILLGGKDAKFMICTWDVASMKEVLMANDLSNAEHQMVYQFQLSCISTSDTGRNIAVNITASTPAYQQEYYNKVIRQFIDSFCWASLPA